MTGASLDEQISAAFDEWSESHEAFGRTRTTFEVACAMHRETGTPEPEDLREQLLAMEKSCAAQFARFARLSEMRTLEPGR